MWRKAEWHHHLVAAVDTGLTAALTRRLIRFILASRLIMNRMYSMVRHSRQRFEPEPTVVVAGRDVSPNR
jgi:hypothetical protein